MKFTQIVVLLSSSIALAHPFGGKPSQPDSSDGYPYPTKDQLREISWRADGTLSNAPPPAKLGDSSKTAFQALVFGEEFEKAYFSSLLYNVTNNIHGYKSHYRYSKSELVKMLTTVVAVSVLFKLGYQPNRKLTRGISARGTTCYQCHQRLEALPSPRSTAVQVSLPNHQYR